MHQLKPLNFDISNVLVRVFESERNVASRYQMQSHFYDNFSHSVNQSCEFLVNLTKATIDYCHCGFNFMFQHTLKSFLV